LGLDLRGGVHFLLQVDMQAAITKRLESLAGDLRSQLRERDIRHGGITREGQTLRVRFRDAATRDKAREVIASNLPDLNVAEREDGQDWLLVATLKPEAIKRTQEYALKQNITTLHNRINELGVAEPVIQQQGADRVLVQLPGVQDTAKAKDILGRTASLLIEKGKGEAITAPVIRSEIAGGRVQISGRMSTTEAADVALLLRAGALAAPMEIIEERTVGPSLGRDNIAKGFNATRWGFVAIVAFMSIYYVLFGLISSVALGVNLLFLVALLSLLQATLTLPGIAAIALTLGMAIDANVLINERIREELRGGATPQAAIAAGYERAWATILDSNVPTL